MRSTSRNPTASPPIRRFGRAILALAACGAAAELSLRTVCAVYAPAAARLGWAAQMIPDARLHHRPNPRFPGHDRNGWRNPRAPEKAFVVALGDSQTYGEGVRPEEAWPRRLEAKLGRPAYSMAFGGYGPVDSLLLMDEALSFRPRVIIEALYSGNDLFDCFNGVYNRGQAAWLRTGDPVRERLIGELEARDPIAVRVEKMLTEGKDPMAPEGTAAYALWSARRFLSEHLAAYLLLHEIKTALLGTPRSQPPAPGSSATLFTPEYRLLALSGDDPRISEGRRIALNAIGQIAWKAAAKKTRLLVLLIPTKELVFWGHDHPRSAAYRALIVNEQAFWKTVRRDLARRGIPYIDALPALRASLAAGKTPYPATTDGHPNADGHAAIAEAVARWEGFGVGAPRAGKLLR